ncbi:hypothetical protein GL267_004860 [Acidithiobacillus ferrianus]|uniref:Uncharacterized protein n=2 Tax=Acidithiobacillus ferrianus TaxID=2678518 RepID=A0A845UA03_9PROT|nr:hypothetical protein [Acidithiobacillus ferrianus]NDU43683.1 hypothetical protein [Acidithiobacillus ferrianus]
MDIQPSATPAASTFASPVCHAGDTYAPDTAKPYQHRQMALSDCSVEKLPLENGMRLKIPHKEKEEAFHFLTGPAGLFGPFSLLSTPALPPSAIDVGGWP